MFCLFCCALKLCDAVLKKTIQILSYNDYINIFTSFNCLIYSVECIKIPHFSANWNCDGVKRFVRMEWKGKNEWEKGFLIKLKRSTCLLFFCNNPNLLSGIYTPKKTNKTSNNKRMVYHQNIHRRPYPRPILRRKSGLRYSEVEEPWRLGWLNRTTGCSRQPRLHALKVHRILPFQNLEQILTPVLRPKGSLLIQQLFRTPPTG